MTRPKSAIVLKVLGAAAVIVVAVFGIAWFASGTGTKTVVEPGAPVMRRLTSEQYKNVVADLFGKDIRVGGRFEPDLRVEGLLAVGTSHVGVSDAGMEQYDAMAHTIASQVVDESHRDLSLPCRPADATRPDDACTRAFFSSVGTLVLRRPLVESQLDLYVRAAREATNIVTDFYDGLAISLAAMLASPQFLFQQQVVEPVPGEQNAYRLDSYSKASQLSFFLWNSMPDRNLLDAAASGELHTQSGIEKQVQRMIASPRLEEGVRAFFADNFRFDEFATLTKDAQLFPKFDAGVAAGAREQTMKTLVSLLLDEREDYRNIFTTKKTFLTPQLGAIYQVPVPATGPNGAPDQWQPYEFGESDPVGGILTHISFTGLHSPPGRGSPTIRGKAAREIMLCQPIPPPPGDVSFELLDEGNEQFRTARQRLAKHNEVPACAGCHRLMDPVGLALENFDGAGEFRRFENGALIDTSGEIDGIPFDDAIGLGEAIRDGTAATSCLVTRLSSYALGREPARGERAWVAGLEADFAENGYRLPDLMQSIALSENFYRTALPQHSLASRAESNISIAKQSVEN